METTNTGSTPASSEDDRKPLSHRPYGQTTLSDIQYEEEQARVRKGLAPSGPFPDWEYEPLGEPRTMPT